MVDVEWKREWFSNIPRFPKSHWNSIDNCLLFMKDIASTPKVNGNVDWRKVTVTLIRNKGGMVNDFV